MNVQSISDEKCIYLLHGFATAPKHPSDKADALQSVFHLPVKQIGYDSAGSFEDNFTSLKAQVNMPAKYFVGTSLGAFYASKLAEHFYTEYAAAPIMLNPCHNPFAIMHEALGQHTNYVTNQTFEFTKQALDSYRDIPFIDEQITMPRYVFLNMDDELIDAHETTRLYGHRLNLMSFPHGGHRFENIASEQVASALLTVT